MLEKNLNDEALTQRKLKKLRDKKRALKLFIKHNKLGSNSAEAIEHDDVAKSINNIVRAERDRDSDIKKMESAMNSINSVKNKEIKDGASKMAESLSLKSKELDADNEKLEAAIEKMRIQKKSRAALELELKSMGGDVSSVLSVQ